MKKRLLQIVPSLARAGTQKQMGLLVCGLPREEFDVHVCALTGNGPLSAKLAAAGIPVVAIGRRWQFDPHTLLRLAGHVSRLRPDLIHTWTSAAHAYGLAASSICGVKRLVLGRRCAGPRKGAAVSAVERFIARRSSRIAVNGAAVRDFCVRCGLPAGKLRVIPNGVQRTEQTGTTRRQLLAELGLPADSRLVGVVGPLLLSKRIKDAIWAADLLKVIRDDVHLLIVGDGPHRRRLRRFRDQVVIRDKVHFLGDRGDVSRMMPHFDVLWSTADCEGQSNAILEALSAGVPVVATGIPGTRELIVHPTTGYLVAVGDRAGFARQTNRLLDDPELAGRIGRAGRERVQREFGVAKMIQQYADLYRELLT